MMSLHCFGGIAHTLPDVSILEKASSSRKGRVDHTRIGGTR